MRRIIPGDFSDPRIADLVTFHFASARAQTGPESAHALDLAGLQSPDIAFWALWEDDTLLGIAALKKLSADHGEVKSMHTIKTGRRQGVGTDLLRHVIAVAGAGSMSRLSLETGSADYFQPARALYRRHGFVECPPFEGYTDDPNSVFMSLDLGAA